MRVDNNPVVNNEEEYERDDNEQFPLIEAPPQQNKVNNKVIEHVSKMDIDNDVQEKLVKRLIELEVYTEEDLLYPKIYDDDLVEPMFKDSDIDSIWYYIREHSPNYVDGRWFV